ncbi:MAG: hypothetical protein HY717_09420 [Planctomycetes bacterium]|nr:hypothetical protein [Planctomycetota bacterium]
MAVSWLSGWGRGELAAADRILVGEGQALPGAAADAVPVSITNDQTIHAFSIVLTYDSKTLILKQVSQAQTVIEQIKAEFFYSTIESEEGYVIIGSIFSYDSNPFQLIELPSSPEAPQTVAHLHFEVSPEAYAGKYPLSLKDNLGSPPVSNVFSIGGKTVHPQRVDGQFTVINQNFLRLRGVKVLPGSRFEVRALGKFAKPLQGYSLAFTYDKSAMSFAAVTYQGTDAASLIVPATIEFWGPQQEPDYSPTLARTTLGVILDYNNNPPFNGQEIPPSPDQFRSLARFTFDSRDDPALLNFSFDLTLTDINTPGFLNNIFIIDKLSFTPEFEHGVVEFTSGVALSRGFINEDARVDLSDGIVILLHLFKGDPPPQCLKAGDVNDDGRFDISDAISLFIYLFTGGAPPAEPFGTCGIDPTDDPLSCEGSPQCE